ncbi:MAG: ABC transporter ATP-binding protein [Actinobacteria bacterium]|nr:MAG: ABC transporter ATP-binding protein [Actinomycetota bacterium]
MSLAALGGVVAGVLIPLVIKGIIDGPIKSGSESDLAPLAGLALLLGVIDCGLAVGRRFVMAAGATGLERDLRDALYEHLQRLHVGFHDRWQSGQMLSRAMGDISTIRRFLAFGLVFLIVCAAQFVLVVALLARLYLPLALLTATAVAPLMLVSASFRRRYGLATTIEESAVGIRVVKAFRQGRLVGAQFAAGAGQLRETANEGVALRARYFLLLDLVPNLTVAVVLLAGALAVGRGALSLGGLVAFVALVIGMVWPIEALGWILANAQEASTAAERVWEIFDAAPAIVDPPGAVELVECQGRLRLEDVGFRYGDDGAWVLRHVSLDVSPGETVAVVGATAAGKTTMVSLLARLHDPSEGRITLDARDIRTLALGSLRRQVAMAFEDPLLFSASVRENLLVGHRTSSEGDMRRALHTAQADFVHDLPWGLDTRVGEQGLSLSGGQRQRLALARAILGEPRVLVLDDPLSALDVHTESLVEDALRRVLDGVTALVVVHRPSTIALADRVAFLEGGTIAAVGTHSELMERIPAYRHVLAQEVEDDEAVA